MNISAISRTKVGRRPAAWLCAAVIVVGGLLGGGGAATAATSSQGSSSAAPVVKAPDGAVRGKTVGAANEFLGIPYAAPPVGKLRWQPPQSAAHWNGVRSATTFGDNCAQPATPFGLPSSSENCLYLNVYAPAGAKPGDGHPVLFWIHGGGLWIGESQDYDPSQLVADGTVVVTINYRLGAFGFLAHPALTGPGGSTGAYGLMDQQAALKWVQRNISQFGGDARNVTIAGESAGGLSVLAQVASPGARGLFSRAIVESGAFALNQTPLATAEAPGKAFATKAGCANQTAACLRSLSVKAIETADTPPPTGWTPGVIDGVVLKQSIASALSSGQFNRVPIINGSNRNESTRFVGLNELGGSVVTAANYQAAIAASVGVPTSIAAVIAKQYPLTSYASPALALSAVQTDAAFACPALKVDQWTSKYVPTFAYEFNDQNAPERFLKPVSFPYGASHIDETQYLFGLPTAPIAGTLNGQQQELASSMQHFWANFAAWGFPSSADEPQWPVFGGLSQQMISLAPPLPQVETNFAAVHQCGFWANAG